MLCARCAPRCKPQTAQQLCLITWGCCCCLAAAWTEGQLNAPGSTPSHAAACKLCMAGGHYHRRRQDAPLMAAGALCQRCAHSCWLACTRHSAPQTQSCHGSHAQPGWRGDCLHATQQQSTVLLVLLLLCDSATVQRLLIACLGASSEPTHAAWPRRRPNRVGWQGCAVPVRVRCVCAATCWPACTGDCTAPRHHQCPKEDPSLRNLCAQALGGRQQECWLSAPVCPTPCART